MTDVTHDDRSAAETALAEVDSAIALGQIAFDETIGEGEVAAQVLVPVLTEQAKRKLDQNQVDLLRQKAQKARERGKEALSKRQDGIASVMVEATLNERVAASAFYRFFSVIEQCSYAIFKNAEMFVGNDADKLRKALTEKVRAALELSKQDLSVVENNLKQLKDDRGDGVLIPGYTKAAATHTAESKLQVKTRLGLAALEMIVNYDKALSGLQILLWNDTNFESNYESDITDQEARAKKTIGDLAKFCNRTVTAMKKKGVAAAAKKPASNDAAPVAEAA